MTVALGSCPNRVITKDVKSCTYFWNVRSVILIVWVYFKLDWEKQVSPRTFQTDIQTDSWNYRVFLLLELLMRLFKRWKEMLNICCDTDDLIIWFMGKIKFTLFSYFHSSFYYVRLGKGYRLPYTGLERPTRARHMRDANVKIQKKMKLLNLLMIRQYYRHLGVNALLPLLYCSIKYAYAKKLFEQLSYFMTLWLVPN